MAMPEDAQVWMETLLWKVISAISVDGKLEVKWSEGIDISHFDPIWLRNHCYTINNKKKYASPYILWDNNLNQNLEG